MSVRPEKAPMAVAIPTFGVDPKAEPTANANAHRVKVIFLQGTVPNASGEVEFL